MQTTVQYDLPRQDEVFSSRLARSQTGDPHKRSFMEALWCPSHTFSFVVSAVQAGFSGAMHGQVPHRHSKDFTLDGFLPGSFQACLGLLAISFSSGCETICTIPSLSSSLFGDLVWVFARPLVMHRFITSCGLHAQSILGSFLLVFHLGVRPSGPFF